jgi:DNA-binding transcriptional ArsR family regulator/uncharacterized protein YndB with AHSA1/START domain
MREADDPVWKALADPVRRQILDLLRDGPQTTGDLCEPFAQSRFGVMKHLDALEGAGLVTVERRGRERWNHLNGAALERGVARWLTPFQSLWSGRLARLTQFLTEEAAMNEVLGSLMEIRQEVDLPATPERVFRSLTSQVGQWWTSPFRQAGAESRLELLPEIGAAMIEHGAGGHSVIWARVEEIAPPSKLYLSGRFAVAGAIAGRVHFELASIPAGCRLTLAHQAIGAIADETRERFVGGWRELLDHRLRAHLAEGTNV